MVRGAQYAAVIVGLGILISGIVLWHRLGRLSFSEVRYEPPDGDEWA